MLEHALNDFQQRDGFDVAVCGCGWEGPPCPDKVTAANFWGQHLLEVANDDQLRSLLVEVLDKFTQKGHPGRPCLRTGWIAVEKVERWRALAQGKHEGIPPERHGSEATDG